MSAIPVSEYGKALYYPYFGVRNINWLKASLLYWDGIRRIGYASNHPDDKETAQAVGAGLLEETAPEPYVESAAKSFKKYFLPLTKRPADFRRLHLDQVNQEMAGINPPFYSLDVRKITESLVWELRESGLAELQGDSVVTETWIAGVYMLCLAIEMSRRIGAPPTTHVVSLESFGEYMTFGKPAKSKHQKSKATLLHLGIDLPNPEDLSDIPMKKILAFHKKYSDERRRFREAVEAIAGKADKIQDPNALFDYLAKERQEIKDAIDDHNRALGYLNIKSLSGLLKISVPTSITALGLQAIDANAAALVAGLGLLAGFTGWWAERRSTMEQEGQSQFHYLLSVNKEFRE